MERYVKESSSSFSSTLFNSFLQVAQSNLASSVKVALELLKIASHLIVNFFSDHEVLEDADQSKYLRIQSSFTWSLHFRSRYENNQGCSALFIQGNGKMIYCKSSN